MKVLVEFPFLQVYGPSLNLQYFPSKDQRSKFNRVFYSLSLAFFLLLLLVLESKICTRTPT